MLRAMLILYAPSVTYIFCVVSAPVSPDIAGPIPPMVSACVCVLPYSSVCCNYHTRWGGILAMMIVLFVPGSVHVAAEVCCW